MGNLIVEGPDSVTVASVYNGQLQVKKTKFYGNDGKAAIKQAFGIEAIVAAYSDNHTWPTKEQQRIAGAKSGNAWRQQFCLNGSEKETSLHKRYNNDLNLINRIIAQDEWEANMFEQGYICERYYNEETDICVLWEPLLDNKYGVVFAVSTNGNILTKVDTDTRSKYSITYTWLV